jgi:hypothetical protein
MEIYTTKKACCRDLELYTCNCLTRNVIKRSQSRVFNFLVFCSVAEPHHFYAAPAPGKNFDAAPAPAPTLLYSKAKLLKQTKVYIHVETTLFI